MISNFNHGLTSSEAMPTYEAMLKMNDEDFRKWLLIRVEEPNKEELLVEMIAHEEKTSSFAKSARREVTPAQQAMLDVFNRNESVVLTKAFDDTNKLTNIDLVMEAIFAKAASDHAGLAKK